ncbi:hypothetical protein PR003_g21087 [Phytophthora rubi]|uniref:Uncharacterized protein n=1 Tax=Phytophthora rubi TaxID=129364 RepID=A0A6A3JDF5_9STRA|nr:hypothetical protein PR002_g20486 [Phytophthora rubi]KAE9307066.1 hypothetical protein PR003_g21087 [Phytophthora rubi]
MQLFLAKAGNKWLNGADAAAVELKDDGILRGFGDQMDAALLLKNSKHFGANFQQGEGEVHVLVVVPAGAVSQAGVAVLPSIEEFGEIVEARVNKVLDDRDKRSIYSL